MAKAKVLGHFISYFDCSNCGYVQTEFPTWLDKAYALPINISDTGIVSRNISNVSLVLATLALIGERKGAVVDYAGGYGLLVRMLRDQGVNAFWSDRYSENLVAKGFEYKSGKVSLVTAFEAFEHFVNPLVEVEELFKISPNILFTTNLIPNPAPLPTDWWYYGLEHGQHIGFYRVSSLEFIARKFNKFLISDGFSCHLLVDKKFSYFLWRIIRIIFSKIPRLSIIGLTSKTWSDHVHLSSCKESCDD